MFGGVPSFAIFSNSLRKTGVNSSLNVQKNSLVKPSGPGYFFAGRFVITDSISFLIIHLFRYFISSWFSLGTLYVSRNYPFFLGYPICWHIIVYSNLLWSFEFPCYQLQYVLFSFWSFSLSIMFVRFIHIVCANSLFLFVAE